MAVTQNTYTGNGSTVLYSFSFPYIETTDIKVSLDGVVTTAYTLANATTVQFNTAPANDVAIRIYRDTDDENTKATFVPGAAIRAQDLNDNFDQILFVSQESTRDSDAALASASSALTQAESAVTTANTAASQVATATTAANTAVTTANTALTTANAASTSAANAVSTANTANTTASNALSIVSEALPYSTVANVAAIPGSPSNGDPVRVADSTGIESFTPLSGLPSGFVGDSGLSVEIYYNGPSSTWIWTRYFPVDPDNRYATAADITQVESDVSQAQSDILGLDSQKLDVTTAASTYVAISGIGTTVQGYDADTVKTDVLPTFTVATRTTERTITAGAFDLATGNLWTVGAITVPNPTNAVAGQTGAIRVTAGPVVWSSNFKFPGGTAPTIGTFPAIIPYYVQDSSTILMGNVVEGIA